jgi:hypothetical protein
MTEHVIRLPDVGEGVAEAELVECTSRSVILSGRMQSLQRS